LDKRQILANQIDSGIVGSLDANQQPRIGWLMQGAQNLGKLARSEFRRSTSA
jgi:hypothetical protein